MSLPTDGAAQTWIKNLVLFADTEVLNAYNQSMKTKIGDTLNVSPTWSASFYNQNMLVHYVYMRSFYTDIPLQKVDLTRPKAFVNIIDSTLKHIENNWQTFDLYQKALSALATHRLGNKEIAQKMMLFLKKSSKIDVSGMHWGQRRGIYWYEMPVETQAILIEAFNEIMHDSAAVFLLKKHLLYEMEGHNRWSSTKATTEAIYALLLVGNETPNATQRIKIGSKNKVLLQQIQTSIGSDNGFINAVLKPSDMDKSLVRTTISNQNPSPITGNISWQFYENMDKVKAFNNVDSVVVLTKQMFKMNSDGEVSSPVVRDTLLPKKSGQVSIGDKIRVKITIKTQKQLEYVHLKDTRPANCEPVDVVSERRWGVLSHYKTTRDVSTNFFFDAIPVGEFTFEYDMTVQQRGDFSSGVASLQCMYAPSVTAYTEGGRLVVK